MESIQQGIQSERAKARRLRSLLAGGGERSGARPPDGKFSDMPRQGAAARAAPDDAGADSIDLWDVLPREAARRAEQGLTGQSEPDGDDLEELINDAERALVGDLGNDFDDLNARWREIAAVRGAKEPAPGTAKKARLLRQMARLWGELEANAKPSRMDDRGSETSSHGRGFGLATSFGPAFGFGAKQPDAPFTEEDWRRLGDSVLRPPSASGQRAGAASVPAAFIASLTPPTPPTPPSPVASSTVASHQAPSGARCCACGAPLVEGQPCNAGARCGACVAAGAFCIRRGGDVCGCGPCHGCGPSFCAGSRATADHACRHRACHGACHGHRALPCNGGSGACARNAGCPGFVGAIGAPLGRGMPARRRDSKGRWLPNSPAPGTAARVSEERGRVGAILREALPSRCAVGDRDHSVGAGARAESFGGSGNAFERPTFDGAERAGRVDSGDSRGGREFSGDRKLERWSRPTDWRPMFWQLALMLSALCLAIGGALQAR